MGGISPSKMTWHRSLIGIRASRTGPMRLFLPETFWKSSDQPRFGYGFSCMSPTPTPLASTRRALAFHHEGVWRPSIASGPSRAHANPTSVRDHSPRIALEYQMAGRNARVPSMGKAGPDMAAAPMGSLVCDNISGKFLSISKGFGHGRLTVGDRFEHDRRLAHPKWGANEPLGRGGESTVSVGVGPSLSAIPTFAPKHWSKKVK